MEDETAAGLSPVQSAGRYFRFCSGVPKLKMGEVPSETCAASVMPVEAHAREISSTAMT